MDEEVDVALVLLGALHRVVEAVGQHDPGRAVLRRRLEIERAVGHQMEGEELHRATSFRKARMLGMTSSAFSTWGACPHFSTMTSRAHRAAAPSTDRHIAGGKILSSRPHTTSDGSLMRCSHFSRSGLYQRGCQPNFVAVKRFLSSDVHLLLGRLQREHAVGEGLVVIDVAHRLLGSPDEEVAARQALDADAGGRHAP